MSANPVGDIKRLIMRSLLAAGGVPVPGDLVDAWCRERLSPRPLVSDVHLAKEELEISGFIIGAKDDLDGTISWTLTTKGELRAKQL